MEQFLLSTVLSFAGLGAAAAVFGTGIYLLIKSTGKVRIMAISYLAISAFYGYSLAINLIRQSSGIRCAMAPLQTLVIYGGLLLLHLYFLWDIIKEIKSDR